MSNRFYGKIKIGGPVKRADLPALLEALSGQFQQVYSEADLVEYLHDGVLLIADDEAPDGRFEFLEKALVKLGSAFDRTSEAKYDYDGERVVFRQGMRRPKIIQIDGNDRFVVLMQDLVAIGQLLEHGRIDVAKKNLSRLTEPLRLQELPRFEIID